MDIKLFEKWMETVRSYGIKPGLTRVKELLRRLDNPQNKLDIIHITGTNGKGSTATLLRKILSGAGYKTGQFSTPSIISYNHMYLIDDHPISDMDLCDIGQRLKSLIEDMIEDGFDHPTEYEIIAAIMYQYYYEQHVDFAVVEVAMGGENDCTNVMDYSILSIITPISLDHQGFLGDTLEKIAIEKSGVIKNNSVLITHPQDESVMKVLKKVCDDKLSVLKTFSSLESVEINDMMTFNYKGLNIESNLVGLHQANNIVGVIESVQSLNRRGYTNISGDVLLKAIKDTVFEGRFEQIGDWILDGAHNHESLMALKNNLQALNIKNVVAVLGVLKDKSIDRALMELKPYFKKVILTEPDSVRKLSSQDLKVKLSELGYKNLLIARDTEEAFILADKEESIKIGLGSFYMIKDLRINVLKTRM